MLKIKGGGWGGFNQHVGRLVRLLPTASDAGARRSGITEVFISPWETVFSTGKAVRCVSAAPRPPA